MNTIAASSIIVSPGRQRRFFDVGALQELVDSIEKNGLMHPIVLRETPNGLELVAGERRMRACAEIWELGGSVRFETATLQPNTLPFVTLGELSELEAEEAQLDENLRRANLTWQEHASAIARLEKLRAAQAKESSSEPPTLESLARETFESKRTGFDSGPSAYAKETIRKELVVSKYLDRPTVRAAKTLDEAFKIVVREDEIARAEALGKSVGATFSGKDHTLLCGDCLVEMTKLEPGFDCLLTDPPYGMGADTFGDSDGRTLPGEDIHLYRDDAEVINRLVLPALEQALLLMKEQAHAYVFCDIENYFQLRAFFTSVGWKPFRTPLVWIKPDGRIPLPQHGPRRTYELLLYAFRGGRPIRKVGNDTLQFPPDTNLNLAAQKPTALFRELLSRSCLPGDSALDPFAGTGTILPAAHDLRVRATAIELNPKNYGIAVKRLQELK